MNTPPRRTTVDRTQQNDPREGNVSDEMPPERKHEDVPQLQESTKPRPDDGGEGILSGVPRETGGRRDPKPASAD